MAAAAAGDKLEGRWPPMRDYGDERQRRGDDDCGGLWQLPRTAMMSTADKKRQRRWRRAINWKDGGRQRETMVMRDSDERRRRLRIGDDDCGGLWQLPRTAMMSTADKKWRRRRRRRRAINWKDGGRRQETMVTRDSDERRRRQQIGDNDCGGLRRLPQTAIVTDYNGVERRWHTRAGRG